MSSATWLFLVLPGWYLSAVLNPFSAGPLTLIPAVGTVSLCFGVVHGLVRRQRKLLLFLIPFIASQVAVAVAGLLTGQFKNGSVSPVLVTFVAAQVLLSGYLVFQVQRLRWTAAALGLFSVTYAAFAAFIAGMALTDTWL